MHSPFADLPNPPHTATDRIFRPRRCRSCSSVLRPRPEPGLSKVPTPSPAEVHNLWSAGSYKVHPCNNPLPNHQHGSWSCDCEITCNHTDEIIQRLHHCHLCKSALLMCFRWSSPDNPASECHHHNQKSTAVPVHTAASHRFSDCPAPQTDRSDYQLCPTAPTAKSASDGRPGLPPAPQSPDIPSELLTYFAP